ncbi:Transcriptional repressor XBP1, partial [Tolypocladium ophioglossoides CBS 100239]
PLHPVRHRHQPFVCELSLSSVGCLLPRSGRPLLAANAVCAMLPLQSLLNPAPAACLRQPASIVVSNSTPNTTTASGGAMDAHLSFRRRPSRSATPLPKSKTQGPVRFPPFEVVDEAAIQHIARYQISSFGQIQQCCEHIPYNSTKKDFYEKTGRESIEAFKYEFRIPGQQTTYKVMWDYNIGLVRMTPFFKCLGYGKTKPSQMLDKNPGLREISPSITGGSVSAQGYWMPYRCARAVCARFCYEIAGALIPLFGPDFPSECTPPRFSDFAEMVISQQLVEEATLEAETSRDAYRTRKATALNGPPGYPRFGGYRPEEEDIGQKWKTPPAGGPDYAAAEVLVRLQKEEQGISTATAGSAIDASSSAEAHQRMRHRANSY